MERVNMKKVLKYDGYFRMLLINGIIFLAISIYMTVSNIDASEFSYIFYIVSAISLLGLIARYFYLSTFGVDLLLVQATIIRIFYIVE